MDRFTVPETAIATFERVHGVLVTLHDFHGRIAPRLAIRRSYHRHPLCHADKARDHQRNCLAFDLVGLHAIAPLHPDGFLQRCHAGLVEAVAPLRVRGEVVGVLFAGPSGEGDLAPLLTRSAPATSHPRLPSWPAEQAQAVLESLRQLACRLERWLAEVDSDRAVTVRDRRSRILHILDHCFRGPFTLPQLAAELGLSVDRTGHVVREEFGVSFLALVAGLRLDRAAALLEHSDLPVATIAIDCGFGDVSGFHRGFRRRFASTPAQYRARTRAASLGMRAPGWVPATAAISGIRHMDDRNDQAGPTERV